MRENTMEKNIVKKYHDAGIRAVGKPYVPPHLLWNLRSTNGFQRFQARRIQQCVLDTVLHF